MADLFPNGIRGLSDSKHSGPQGSAYRLVGVDFHSTPGVFKAHQKLNKISGDVVTELCKHKVPVSNNTSLWFSSESGKIWQEKGDEISLIHTITPQDADSYIIADKTDVSVSFWNGNTPASIPNRLWSNKVSPIGNTVPEVLGVINTYEESASATLSYTIQAKKDQFLLILTGSVDEDNIESVSGLTVNTNSTTSLSDGSSISASYDYSYRTAKYKVLADGDQNIEVTYNDPTTNRFLYVVIIDNASDITATGNEGGTGTSETITDIAQLKNEVHVMFGFSQPVDTHRFGDNQIGIHQSRVAKDQYGATISVSIKKAPAITDKVITLGAEEFDGYVYYAVQSVLYRVAVNNLLVGNFSPEVVGLFKYQDDANHSMGLQNLQLFIGDDITIAKINENHEFISETEFIVKAPERITVLKPYDIDLLVGTGITGRNRARVLRWDTESESWYAEDDIEETRVNAFIPDDNYMYVNVGDFGKIYFYNGEKLEQFLNIPGLWGKDKKAVIHQSAVATLFNIPRFGLSNIIGNPNLQGVYSLGSYSRDYPKVLDLSFPISSDEMEDVEIGAILTRGNDMYVAWKSDTGAGIDKLDWNQKYGEAYIETMELSMGAHRSDFSQISKIFANYVELPENTDITFGINSRYELNFEPIEGMNDTKRLQVRTEKVQPSLPSPQLRIALISNNNDSPVVESITL